MGPGASGSRSGGWGSATSDRPRRGFCRWACGSSGDRLATPDRPGTTRPHERPEPLLLPRPRLLMPGWRGVGRLSVCDRLPVDRDVRWTRGGSARRRAAEAGMEDQVRLDLLVRRRQRVDLPGGRQGLDQERPLQLDDQPRQPHHRQVVPPRRLAPRRLPAASGVATASGRASGISRAGSGGATAGVSGGMASICSSRARSVRQSCQPSSSAWSRRRSHFAASSAATLSRSACRWSSQAFDRCRQSRRADHRSIGLR